jgi:hypothetical protein
LIENDRVLLTMLATAFEHERQYDKALEEVNKALLLPAKRPEDYRDGYRVKGLLFANHFNKKKDALFYLNKAANLGDEKAKEALKTITKD